MDLEKNILFFIRENLNRKIHEIRFKEKKWQIEEQRLTEHKVLLNKEARSAIKT